MGAGILPAAWSNRGVALLLAETVGRHAAARCWNVVLTGGARLQIAPGVDAATLRTVLAVLRESA